MKQNRVCKQIQIKSQNELKLFQQRETHHFEGTLKIVLGKLTADVQQIWFQQFRNCPIQQLRDLHSNQLAFENAALISKTCHKLSQIYGNFILNQNMVFKTLQDDLFIWINPDIFTNSSKIFLPQNSEGQISMIKSLINYFKLWLHADFNLLSLSKTLQELSFKLSGLRIDKKQSSNSNANSTKVQSDFHDQANSNGSKQFDEKLSFTSKNIGKNLHAPSVKNSEPGLLNKSVSNKYINKNQFKHIFANQNSKNQNLSSKYSQSGFDTFQDIGLQSNVPSNNMSKTTGNSNSKLFPHKTTSTHMKILQQIKKADQNPDQYIPNNIKLDQQKLKQLQEQQKKKKMKQSLGYIGQQLDNLFTSNMQSDQQDPEQALKRQKQFEDLLDI